MSDIDNQQRPGRARLHTQERAQKAWEYVDAVTKEGDGVQARYGTLARKLPSYLQVSGLGQTLAFLYAKRSSDKKTTAEGRLLEQLTGYLRSTLRRERLASDVVMSVVLALEPAEYRRATREIAALATWLKRFAEGRLP